jgi:hypothetical protein
LALQLIFVCFKEYNKKMKEHEELLKWTGNMTPLDMIQLYNGDPCQYFYDQVKSLILLFCITKSGITLG